MSENDTLGAWGFTPPPEPPRRRRWVRAGLVLLGIAVVALVAGIAVGAATEGGHKASPGPMVSPVTSTANPATTAPPPTPAPSASSADLTGPLGTEYTITSQDQDGNSTSYDVAAARIADPAKGADEFNTPDPGKRLVGVEFTITGDTGYSTDDANSDAVIIGDDGQSYTADFSSISEGTNFSNGDFGVRANQTQVGWVTFQVPQGVRVSSVQWQVGIDQQPAEWDLP